MSPYSESGKPVLNIAILCQQQFGSHVDTYYYCKYLSKRHKVTYICWDYGRTRQFLADVSVRYVSRNHNLIVRNLLYLVEVCTCLRRQVFDICFIKYFRGCSILPILFPRANFIFDIRSGSISKNWLSRFVYDGLLKFESRFFRHVTVISSSLRYKLGLEHKAHVLPVGSVSLSPGKKTFQALHLLYVGTLSNRNIDRTIQPFARFVRNRSHEIECSYTIIGSGPRNEEDELRSLVARYGIADRVHVVGRVPFGELGSYFDTHNVGVSFVPMTPFFDVQPVTKTFDYLLSGMVVIATATSENKLVIDERNGVLIDDTADGFYDGLEKIMAERTRYRSAAILENAQKYHRDNITRELERSMLDQAGVHRSLPAAPKPCPGRQVAAARKKRGSAVGNVLVTVPRLHVQGGVAGFYNAVLPHFQRGLVTPLQIGGGGRAETLNPVMDQLHFQGAIRKKASGLVHINPSLCFKCLVRDGLFAWQTKRSGLPLVVFWHGWNRGFEQQVSTRYIRYFLKTFGRADAFIVLARDFEHKLREWGVAVPVFRTTTAVAESLLEGFSVDRKGKEFFEQKVIKILFLSRLERSKGVFETVKAVKILLEKGVPVRLTVAGEGPVRQELEALAHTLNLGPEQVSFTGDVRGQDKAGIFRDHHIYCFPTSYGEGLPTSVLEAMAFAMPVVTRPVGGLTDMFEDGRMGGLVHSDSPEEVAERLMQLLGNPGKMAEIGRYNGDYAEKRFMASAVKNRLMAIYEEVSESASQ